MIPIFEGYILPTLREYQNLQILQIPPYIQSRLVSCVLCTGREEKHTCFMGLNQHTGCHLPCKDSERARQEYIFKALLASILILFSVVSYIPQRNANFGTTSLSSQPPFILCSTLTPACSNLLYVYVYCDWKKKKPCLPVVKEILAHLSLPSPLAYAGVDHLLTFPWHLPCKLLVVTHSLIELFPRLEVKVRGQHS